MKDKRHESPFKTLGEKLKTIRQGLHETVADVSGAVEIDEQSLQRIEQGSERPSEDILLLLINHFGVADDDATKLWELAGYEDHDHDDDPHEAIQQGRTMVMIMAIDPRIIYSDGAQVTANSAGVVINFSQGAGTPQAITTARIGMSREQAQSLIQTLQKTMEQSKPRQLPPSAQNQSAQTKQKPSEEQK